MMNYKVSCPGLKNYKISGLGWLMFMILLPLLIASCAKDNNMGKLRGQWQLMTVERPDTETVVADAPRLYMSFDQGLLQLTTSDDKEMFAPQYIATVSGEEPNLKFNFPYDTYPESMDELAKWGIDTNPANVKVIELNAKSLVLDVDGNILTLRRF